MGIDTKAVIRKGVTLEDFKAHAEKKYGKVSVDTTYDEDFFYLRFQEEGGENRYRNLAVFLDPTLAERDYGINGILLSLGCWGESVSIMMHFLEEFGGFIDESDCDDIGFQAVNIHKLEDAREYTPKEKFKQKLIFEFGAANVDNILKLCEEYKDL
jgi:hypothetical protein